MDLDYWNANPNHGIPEAHAAVRQPSGVQQNHVGPAACLMKVTGGENLSSGNTFADHWVYDPATDRWTSSQAMPTARHGLDSATDDERWYVVGGGTGAGARTFLSLTSLIEVYLHRKKK